MGSRENDVAQQRTSEDNERFTVNRAEISRVASQLQNMLGIRRGAGQNDTESSSNPIALAASLATGSRDQFLNSVVRERYEAYVKDLMDNSPRILLVGDTSLGKSNLVNIVFGFHPEETGEGAEVRHGGRPCTQNFHEYGPTEAAPVRIIDSKGVEKLSVQEQMNELRSYISDACASRNHLEFVHLVWYFVGERWQDGDKMIVTELQTKCAVVLVLSKCDQRSKEGIANMKEAILADIPDIDIAECGDPRGTRNWIPESCPDGHGPDWIEVSMRTKTWRCVYETTSVPIATAAAVGGDAGEIAVQCGLCGDDSPFGHKELVRMSRELLPKFCRQSFLTAQRVDMNQKHVRAAAVIAGFTASAAGVGAVPVPFADLPVLLAMEATMGASLMAVYGVPLSTMDSGQLVQLHSGIIGVGGAVGYMSAQVLKSIPGLNVAGSSIDMIVAGTAVMTLGISLSVVLTRYITADTPGAEDIKTLIVNVAKKLDVGAIVRSLIQGHGTSQDVEQQIASAIEDNARR